MCVMVCHLFPRYGVAAEALRLEQVPLRGLLPDLTCGVTISPAVILLLELDVSHSGARLNRFMKQHWRTLHIATIKASICNSI